MIADQESHQTMKSSGGKRRSRVLAAQSAPMKLSTRLLSFSAVSCALIPVAFSQSGTMFTDIPSGRSFTESILWSASAGLMKAFPDGTFRPQQTVDRATALTLLMRLHASAPDTASGSSSYSDVAADAWYMPAVESALSRGIIDGPPSKTQAFPSRTVSREEFLKMLFQSEKFDLTPWSGVARDPLSMDLPASDAWDDPYIRAALALGMIEADSIGNLSPTQALNRADIAELLFRFNRAKKGGQTQALVSASEREIERFLSFFTHKNVAGASYSAARLGVLGSSAQALDGKSPVIKGIVAVQSAFTSLLSAYDAVRQKHPEAMNSALDAARTTAKAIDGISPVFHDLSAKVLSIALALENQAAARK